jgi:hypothetical protein
MASARNRAEWQRTATLMALIANCHRDPKKTRAFAPEDFLEQKANDVKPIKASIDVLRAFVEQ